MKKTEDSSCSIPSHFWSTSRSPFLHSIYHFKAQEVKNPTLQTVYDEEDMAFGRQLLQACAKFAQHLEIRTTPSACAKLVRNSYNTFQICTAHAWCEFSSVPPTPLQIFSFRYFCINFHSSPCNPPIIRFLSQEGWKTSLYIFPCIHCKIYKDRWRYKYINKQTIQSLALFFSLLLFFPISIFLVAKQPLRAFPQRMIG